MSIRVLVADDQSMVRAGFRMLLAGEHDIEVVAEASNGREAVAMTARFNPAVVLMDIRMPEIDGIEATRRIQAGHHAARILILTTFGLDEYVFEALRAGASGFVLKDDPAEQLIAAVRTVAAGASVGYGGSFHAPHDMRIGVVPAGYADGVPRALSNRGAFLVDGALCPIVGRVAMNMTEIDLSRASSSCRRPSMSYRSPSRSAPPLMSSVSTFSALITSAEAAS